MTTMAVVAVAPLLIRRSDFGTGFQLLRSQEEFVRNTHFLPSACTAKDYAACNPSFGCDSGCSR